MSLNVNGTADTVDALQALVPGAQWIWSEEEGLNWLDSNEQTKPTQSAIDAKIIELQADYDAKQYQRDRAAAYPSIQDQLDMMYHDQVDGTTTWKDAVAAVKAAHPQPE